MRFITAILTLAGMLGTAVGLGAQYTAPDSGQEGYQAQEYPQQGTLGQDEAAADQQRAVARLSIAQGDVNVKRGDSGDLVAAVVNAPLLAQDHIQTSAGSRAEVQLDYANMIRLAPNTDIGFADLQYHRYQIQLGAGSIIYRVLRDSDSQTEIDTPSVAVRPSQQGDYRVSVLDDGSTEITVRSGELEVYSPHGTERLEAGRSMLVRGDSSDPEFQMADQPAPDQFDEWSANRDRTLLASQSYQHVSRDIYGADDLDAYGNWVPSQYGNVWAPRSLSADWAPYSSGRWVWEGYYGWTWVDDEPWGWAPYHYGRWFNNPGHGWCWWPGSIASSYYWSPAVVGFFGWGGGGFSIGIGGGWGSIGWVALAPFETFHRWWGGGSYGGEYGNYTNIHNTTINNITNITNIYRNAGKGGAVSCPSKNFGQPHQNSARATPNELRKASVFRSQLPITPTRASRQFSNRQATPNPRLASVANRRFYQSPRAAQSARASSGQQFRTQPGSRAAANPAPLARTGGFARAGQPGLNISQGGAQREQATAMSRGSAPRALQNSRTGPSLSAAPQRSLNGMPPNTRSQTGERNSLGRSTQASAPGWQRFGETGTQRGPSPAMSRDSGPRVPQNSGNRANIDPAPQQSVHGTPPNLRTQTGGRSSFGPSQSSAAGWHRFGEPGIGNGPRRAAQPSEQSGWHSFGQSQRAGSGSYGGARPGIGQAQPRYNSSFNLPHRAPNTAPNSVRNYGGNYQSRPLGSNQPTARPPQSSFGYRGGSNYGSRPGYGSPNFDATRSSHGAPAMPRYSAPSAPRYSAPSAPRYSAPSMPHYSAPSAPRYSAPSAPRYSAPSMPHYSAPSAPHYSAPAPRGGGGTAFRGGGSSSGGSRGGHSSSDGRRSR